MRAGRKRFAGFTLIESLIAAAILALAVAAFSQAVGSGQMQTFESVLNQRGLSLAEALIEEIVAHPYGDPNGASVSGPESDETTRASFDNCDDFHGFSESPGTLKDAHDVAYGADYQMFSRSAEVVSSSAAIFGRQVNGLLATVTVKDSKGHQWVVKRFIPEP